jgi:hypothetical protein
VGLRVTQALILNSNQRSGGARGARTPDLLHAMQALSQLSYGPAPDDTDAGGACVTPSAAAPRPRPAPRRARRMQWTEPLGVRNGLFADGATDGRQSLLPPAFNARALTRPGPFLPARSTRGSTHMARTRSTTATPRAPRTTARSRRDASQGSVLVQTAERMVGQIETLVVEIEALRADNEGLRAELRDAVSMLERASKALGDAGTAGRRGRRRAGAAEPGPARRGVRLGVRGAAPRVRRTRGRATPEGVTPQVVHAVIAKLGGEATAAEIAAEITRNGVPVSGRAVRFLAERAGAQTVVGEDGQRRYRVS